MATGALTPQEASQATYNAGMHHLYESSQLRFVKNVYGGFLIGFGGLLSDIASEGCPGLKASNPGLVRLLHGVTFPVSLICAYTVGAEFITAYPMWFLMTACKRQGRPLQYLWAIALAWTGNLLGAVFSAYVFSFSTGILAQEPYRSGVVGQIVINVVDARWHVSFVKAMGCGFLVTLSVFLGTQFQDGASKALGLHLPFFISVVATFPHTVEYMYEASLGMMLGAPLSIPAYFYKCLAPITLGNFVGGAAFTGAYFWYVFIYCEDGERTDDWLEGFLGLDSSNENRGRDEADAE